MTAKRRHAAHTGTHNVQRGAAHPAAKLREFDVLAIRAEYGAGAVTQRQLALRYGVSQRTIAKIVTGAGWVHV